MSNSTTAHAPIRLTPELIGAAHYAIEGHLAGRVQAEVDALNLGHKPDTSALFSVSRKLRLCAAALCDLEQDYLRPDGESEQQELLAVLADCEREATESIEYEAEQGLHADDLVLAQARGIMVRQVREMVEVVAGPRQAEAA
jgi:hypothetical protein